MTAQPQNRQSSKDGCEVRDFSSAVCERGTKGCGRSHPDWEQRYTDMIVACAASSSRALDFLFEHRELTDDLKKVFEPITEQMEKARNA